MKKTDQIQIEKKGHYVDNTLNYTQVSNHFLDNLQQFSSAEKDIFLFITRKISGWHKETQTCSISYIMVGTGLSRQSVITGTKKLLKNNWIKRIRVRGNNGYTYEYSLSKQVFISDTTSQKFRPVKNLDQSKILTSTSLKFRPNAVQNLDTIKETNLKKQFKETKEKEKEKKKKEEKETKKETKKKSFVFSENVIKELKELLEFWNTTKSTHFKYIESLLHLFDKCRKIYTIEEMQIAIKKIKYSKYWSDSMTPNIFFKTEDAKGNPLDYVAAFLNIKTNDPTAARVKTQEEKDREAWMAQKMQPNTEVNTKHLPGSERLAEKFRVK